MRLSECPSGSTYRRAPNNAIFCAIPIYPYQTVLTFVKSGRGSNRRTDLKTKTPVSTRRDIDMHGKKPYFGKYNLTDMVSVKIMTKL